MAPPEKRLRVLPSLRVGESLESALMRLAAREERSLSGYLVRVLEKHCFGHAQILEADSQLFNDDDAAHGRPSGHGHLTSR